MLHFGAEVLIFLSICRFFLGGAIKSTTLPIKEMSQETRECVKCHQKNNPGLVQEWGKSKHYGANVGCYECHAAEKGDVDAYVHDDKKVKKLISILVTPKDCGTCHEKAAHEMTNSRHAKARTYPGVPG